MQKSQGNFILFDMERFGAWLAMLRVGREIRTIQNHHTYTPCYQDFNGTNHFTLMEQMAREHLARGFAEIAQQLTTFPDGTVAIGRSFEQSPACIYGQNAAAICVENFGNFDTGSDDMTLAQRQTIIRVNALLCRKYAIPLDTTGVVYHHWFDLNTGERTDGSGSTKSCPGTAFFGGNTVADAEVHFLPMIRAVAIESVDDYGEE